MDLIARTFRSLEWDKVKALLASYSLCPLSKDLCLDLALHEGRETVEVLLGETDEALLLLHSGSDLGQPGLKDLRSVFQRLSAGGALSAQELNQVRQALLNTKRSKLLLASLNASDFPRLSPFLKRLQPQDKLVQCIAEAIDEQAQILDGASSELRRLRKELSHSAQKIKEELSRIINSPSLSKCLQEPIFTMRNGRHVLPVEASMRGSIKGIVHDSSASGLTVYVEPLTVVELTNRMRLVESRIEQEIERILKELSHAVQLELEAIVESFETLVDLDFINCRASFARSYSGIKPRLSEDGSLSIREARHPLLSLQLRQQGSEVVANDICLNRENRTLIITGPNTGGKTVLLKTAGLLSLMLRGGLLISAAKGSQATIFSQIFADVGDEQSLEHNLSTFSAHMGNLISMVELANEKSLVLFDEIGAGTDPKEGVALAGCILRELNSRGVYSIATTHLNDLKNLAHSQAGFANASMEFAESSLSPTYRLLYGVAGRSHAIAIASRLGLAENLVRQAREEVERNKEEGEIKIEELEKRLHSVSLQELEIEQRRATLNQLEQESHLRLSKIREAEQKSKAEIVTALEESLAQGRKQVADLIAELQRQPSLAKAQQAMDNLAKMKAELELSKETKAKKSSAASVASGDIVVGARVKVLSLGQTGLVKSLAAEGDKRGLLTVICGKLKLKVKATDLEFLAPPTNQKSASVQVGRVNYKAAGMGQMEGFVRTSFNTLDLRGQRVDESLRNLEPFVDQAYRQQLMPVMVIHGHGTGAVKAAVRQYLGTCPYKLRFRAGEIYEGGDGVTVIFSQS